MTAPATPPKTKPLSAKRMRFCHEYVVDLNATQAAMRAGYGTGKVGEPAPRAAQTSAYNLMRMPAVRECIAALQAEKFEAMDLSARHVLTELMRVGFANMADYVQPDNDGLARVDLSNLTREQWAAVGELTVTQGKRDGEECYQTQAVKFKLADKLKGLELLARHLKLLTDKVEAQVTGDEVLVAALLEGRARRGAASGT